jgi:threonine dehydratase
MLKLTDFIAAHNRIKSNIFHTPLEESVYFSNDNYKVYLKLENQQKTKSFKIRGALNKMAILTDEEKENGVVTISSGNHGIAVSHAAKLMNIKKIVVFVPEVTPEIKINKIKKNGAEVIIAGNNYDETHALGIKYINENTMTFIDPYDKDYDVYAGQGTIALEILLDNPSIDTLIVPVSGGGLVTGVGIAAKLIKPDIKVIGIQTEACPAFVKSFNENIFYPEYPEKPSVCEALMGGAGVEPYKLAHQSMDQMIEVSEESIKKATEIAISYEKIILEPSSAIGMAAILENPQIITGKNVAIVVSGGNINNDFISFDFNQRGD